MKTILALTLLFASSLCWGWNCPAGQIRQQAPAGTPVTTPYYDVVEGIAFICVPSTPNPNTPPTTTNTNTLTNTNNNTLQQTQNQTQNQGQSQTATGGSASSTSSSSATGGAGGAGGNATSSATNNGNGNGNGSNNSTSVTNVAAPKIPVTTAIAPPVMPTVPCFKGVGGSVQTMAFGGSFGGGKVDQGCDDRELARSFSGPQTVASCKILINTKKAKRAGIKMEDCLTPPPVEAAPVMPVMPVVAPSPVPQVIVIPVTVQAPAPPCPPEYRTSVDVHPPHVTRPVRKPVKHLPPNCQNVLQRVCK